MTQMTNSAAVRILKEISTDKFRSHDLGKGRLAKTRIAIEDGVIQGPAKLSGST